jgi:hypothetical protein
MVVTFGNFVLSRNGTIATCSKAGVALARVNLFEATDEVPLVLWMADNKFEFTLEQTRAFLDGMPRPAPKVVEEPVAEEPVAEATPEVAEEPVAEKLVAEEATPVVPSTRRGRR